MLRAEMEMALLRAVERLAKEQNTGNLIAYLAICEQRDARDDAARALDAGVRLRLGITEPVQS